ncbi:MAG: DUF1552 domain-containing protein [bacterium]
MATPLLRPALSRRTFLRGAGAALALPFLEAMLPRGAQAQGMGPRTRFLAWYVPCGIHMPAWTPADAGAGFTLSPMLESLAPYRDRLTVLTGLANRPARPDGPGDHAAGTGSFLTAAHCFKTEGADIRNGISIDQVIANGVGSGHRFPSLVLGAEGGGNAGGCDSGYSCAYSRNISWVGEATPAAREVNPGSLFNRMFGGSDPRLTQEQIAKKRRYRRSILDFVREDAERLQPRLGQKDRQKIQEYLDSVREVERSIDLAEAQQCVPGVRPERPDSVGQRIEQMADLMALAFQCDLTPVITFMFGNAGSNRSFTELGIAEGHHQLSHHQGAAENHAKLQIIGTHEVEVFARFLGRLRAIEEPGGGTVLDNSVIFFSSEIEDGNAHRHENLPILLAGGASGQLAGGRHLVKEGKPPIADLFITLAGYAGVELAAFGDEGTGAMDLG